MARQSLDALCIDPQHGTAEMNDVGSQTDTAPVVRVAWNEPAAIMKALDLGAYGTKIRGMPTTTIKRSRRFRMNMEGGGARPL
jgi:2-keto-3-deoxy-L-rhamnonate aldolase RhmA